MLTQWYLGAVILFGATIGSFLNVCIHRLPLRESLARPGSRCPHCAAPIRWHDNIPLLSYLWLWGRCRDCRGPISVRYPLVEGLNALGYGLIVWRLGMTVTAMVYALLFSALIVVSVIDLDHGIIPNEITYPGMVLGLGIGAFILPHWWDSFLGFLLGGGVLYIVAEAYFRLTGKEGMGYGDVKLLAMVGAFIGSKLVLISLLLSSLVGSVVGLSLIAARQMKWREYIKFGPFLSLGTGIAILYGVDLWNWYQDLIGTLLPGGP